MLLERLEIGAALPACWVLELSSFQIETMQGLDAEAATVLNVTDDHLDRYADLRNMPPPRRQSSRARACVLAREDARVAAMALPGRRTIRFGTTRRRRDADYGLADLDGRAWLVRRR